MTMLATENLTMGIGPDVLPGTGPEPGFNPDPFPDPDPSTDPAPEPDPAPSPDSDPDPSPLSPFPTPLPVT